MSPRTRRYDRHGRYIREARGEQQPRWFHVGTAVFLLVAVLGAGLIGPALGDERSPVRTGPESAAAPQPSLRDEVRSKLLYLRGQWSSHVLSAIDRSELMRRRYEPVLREYLQDPDDPLFAQAAMLAVEQGNTRLLPQLRRALRSAGDATQRVLVAEIDRLEPWDGQELRELLDSDQRGLVLGACDTVARRSDRPVDQLVRLLFDEDAAIRSAALVALPELLGNEVAGVVLSRLPMLAQDRAGAAIAALTRCPATAAVEEVLYTQLDGQTEHAAVVLDGLLRRGTELSRPEAVTTLVKNGYLPVGLRGRALRCLEVCGGASQLEELDSLRFDHPVLDYLAARVLLRAGRSSALQRLVTVLREAGGAGHDADAAGAVLAQEACIGARRILAQLSGTTMQADVDVWEDWVAAQPDGLEVTRLPPAAVTLPY